MYMGLLSSSYFRLSLRTKGSIRTALLAELFSAWPHLDSGVVETLLDRLTESSHLIRHDYKNRFGGWRTTTSAQRFAPNLGKLRGKESRDLIVADGRQIGSVPAGPIEAIFGSCFPIRWRHWQVTCPT